jgi:hypothetical protein
MDEAFLGSPTAVSGGLRVCREISRKSFGPLRNNDPKVEWKKFKITTSLAVIDVVVLLP